MVTEMTSEHQRATPQKSRPVFRWLDGYTGALFAGSPAAYAAFAIVIAVWALELAMNTRNGHGWVAIAHFVIVGPLWLVFTGVTLYAFARQILGWGGRPAE